MSQQNRVRRPPVAAGVPPVVLPILDRDGHGKLEAHLRVKALGGDKDPLAAFNHLVESITWPDGQVFWGIKLTIQGDGYIPLPETVIPLLEGREWFLMVKLVVNPPAVDYTWIACRYPNTVLKHRELRMGIATDSTLAQIEQEFRLRGFYTMDISQYQRENGQFVYSIPIHCAAPGKSKFFFLLHVVGEDEKDLDVEVARVTITRGKAHFRIAAERIFSDFGPINRIVKGAAATDQVSQLQLRFFLEYWCKSRKEPEGEAQS